MIRVVVVDSPEGHGRDLSVERAHLPPDAEIVQVTYRGDETALVDACGDAVAILADYAPLRRSLLARLPTLEVISIAATGWDAVDLEAAREFGVSVCCVREYCTGEVADHTLALLLALNRRLLDYDRQVRRDRDWAWDRVTGLRRLAGQVLGIVGLGRIGRAVAARARGFGLGVIAHDPWLSAAEAPVDIPLLPLDALLARADIISLHCNATPDQAPLLDASAFAAMARRPLLINVARGSLVDENALLSALERGAVAGAALDVLAEEPPDLAANPLVGRDDVLVTPHVAFSSEQALDDVRRISAQNIRHALAGNDDRVFAFVHRANQD
jgi:D-3-phosphoglycerate dehydrogenase